MEILNKIPEETGGGGKNMCVIIVISFLIFYIFLISYVCNYFFSHTINI